MAWKMEKPKQQSNKGSMNGIFTNTCRIVKYEDQSKKQNSEWAKDVNIMLKMDLLDKQNEDGSYWQKNTWIKGNHKKDEVSGAVLAPPISIQDLFASTETYFEVDDAGNIDEEYLEGLVGKECKMVTFSNNKGSSTMWGKVFSSKSSDEYLLKKFSEHIAYLKDNGYSVSYAPPKGKTDPSPDFNPDELDEAFGWDENDL
tara:strand:- start:10 stop:609 length:600 start_codon:yes stop_codon:yes gene_type:complete